MAQAPTPAFADDKAEPVCARCIVRETLCKPVCARDIVQSDRLREGPSLNLGSTLAAEAAGGCRVLSCEREGEEKWRRREKSGVGVEG
jgi:hypothetical protein